MWVLVEEKSLIGKAARNQCTQSPQPAPLCKNSRQKRKIHTNIWMCKTHTQGSLQMNYLKDALGPT